MSTVQIFNKILLGILFSLAFISPALAEAASQPVLNIQHWQTSQNIPVYFVNTPEIPMVIINVIFTAGSAYDGKNWGIAEITANLLNQGTEKRTANQIANDFADVGAQFESGVNQDMAVIGLKTLSEPKYLEPALNVFTDVLNHPAFSSTAFLQQQQLALASIKQSQQDPESIAGIQFYQTLYQEHPYGHSVDGTLETVNKLNEQDAIHFYHQFYVANNAKMVMVGDLKTSQAKQIAEKITSGLQLGESAPKLPGVSPLTAAVSQHITFPANQTTMIIGQLGITRNDPDYFPLFVGNFVLGDLPLDSLLFQEVRKKRGLAYDASSNFIAYLVPGIFLIELQTRSEAASEALQVTRDTLQNFIKQGPSPAQLDLAKKLIVNSFPISIATNENISAILSKMIFYQLPLDYLDTYRAKIQAVTADQIKQAFMNHVQPDKMITVTVGTKNRKNN